MNKKTDSIQECKSTSGNLLRVRTTMCKKSTKIKKKKKRKEKVITK